MSKVAHRRDVDVPVMFFGTLEIAWINKADVVPFAEGVQKGFLSKGKQKGFIKAVEQVCAQITSIRKAHWSRNG